MSEPQRSLGGLAALACIACVGRGGFELPPASSTAGDQPSATCDSGFCQIAAASDHTCGLSASQRIYCWGSNEWGQLGNGDSPNPSAVPVLVDVPFTFIQVVTGTHMTCGLTDGGVGYCWGRDSFGELGTGDPRGKGDRILF